MIKHWLLTHIMLMHYITKAETLAGLGNYTGAIVYYDKALAIDPRDKFALTNKGAALDGLGNHAEAIQYYDKALAIDPHFVLALNGKGWALYKLRLQITIKH